MDKATQKPSVQIQVGLSQMLQVSGELKRFADHNDFDFNSLYKIAKNQIRQPGVDYGNSILNAINKWPKQKNSN
jgi:hypothetical protein